MAKRPKKKAPEEKILPLSGPFWNHHSEVVMPAMRQWVENRTVPPVLLMTGPSGIGKHSVAHYLAQWLLCSESPFAAREDTGQGGLFGAIAPEPAPADTAPRLEPCGECAACHRALDGNWIDFTEIAPESESEGKAPLLKIERFRKLKSTQGFGAHEGPFRITLIRDAERMTTQAANSVLKLLEEPPPGWIFFLTASDLSLLLPTLVSRCQRLNLKPFPEERLDQVLEPAGLPPDRRRIVSRLAGGSWSRAIELAEDATWEKRTGIFRFLQCPQEETPGLVDWAAQDPRHMGMLLDQFELILSDLVRWSLQDPQTDPGSYGWANSDGRRSMAAHAAAASRKFGSPARARQFWIEQAERLAEVRRKSNAPLNRKILVQELLVPWLET